MSRRTFSLRLRDQDVEIELSIVDPDPSVGIMGTGFEDEQIYDQDGQVLDWELTEAETDQVLAALDDARLDDDPFDDFEAFDPLNVPW
jgi:hypothetical protein